MQRSLEQRMAIMFCVKLEKSAAETIPMLKAFGVDCLSDRQIFRWHKAFAEGREDVNDENRAGRPSTSSSDDNDGGVPGSPVLRYEGMRISTDRECHKQIIVLHIVLLEAFTAAATSEMSSGHKFTFCLLRIPLPGANLLLVHCIFKIM
ncbi:hypothetical protein NQ318_000821 [Aromia moschata]|uniref:Mos1 transposase HTH domain-containing protein n=1 Tax=Aromia moschata TaxID=1265417 RepID=A0AAV8XA95_9CUCU|nr:hypothetical protein NQ318_000821 [Aromia moschata]